MNATMIVTQLLLSFLGSLGFALIFKVPDKHLIPASFGGVICWAFYLIGRNVLSRDVFIASLLSTAAAALYAELSARNGKVPLPVYLIPSYVPLIPGSGLYYTMSSAVAKDWDMIRYYGVSTITCAFGMALGMSLVFACFDIHKRLP